MKSALISIRPRWCQKIISGEKTIEVRKTRPRLNPPLKCYIYQTGKGGVIGEFICHEFIEINGTERITSDIARGTCLAPAEIHQYLGAASGYGWRISNLKIYNTPRGLEDFRRACKNNWWCDSCAMYWENNGACGNASLQIRRPPQSWCYVAERTMYDVSLRSFGKTVFLHEAAEKALAEMKGETEK